MRDLLTKTFYIVFTIMLTFFTGVILFFQYHYWYKLSKVPPLILLELCLIIAIFLVVRRFSAFFARWYLYILITFCTVMFGVQVYNIQLLRYEPVNDLAIVYDSAVEWLQTGTFDSQSIYFYSFPSSLGFLTLLRIIFGLASLFGITDFFAVASVTNALMCCIMFACVSLICRKLYNSATSGIMALVLIALTRPLYYSAPAFYTDMLSIIFPALGFLIYLHAKEASTARKKYWLYSALGLTLAVGALIKFTVLILFIAIVIDSFLTFKKKGNHQEKNNKEDINQENNNKAKNNNQFGGLLCSFAVIIAVFFAFNLYIYSFHLDRKTSQEKINPVLHWVYMGLSEPHGSYNQQDYEFTWSRGTKAEKQTALMQGIISRLKSKDIGFFMRKIKVSIGNGELRLYDFGFSDNSPLRERLVDINGTNKAFRSYSMATMAHLLLLYILMIVYTTYHAVKRKTSVSNVVYLSIFGLFLFMMLWEGEPRYKAHFLSMFIIGGVMSMELIGSLIFNIAKKHNRLETA